MASPFPGMDPFLEEPSGWTGVYHRLISVISDTLTEQVAPHFSVSIEERVYISDDDDPDTRQQIAPDICPSPPLRPADAAWAAQCIAHWQTRRPEASL